MRKHLTLLLLLLFLGLGVFAQTKNELTAAGTGCLVNGQPVPYTGLSFSNALCNPTFNQSPETRAKWLEKFGRYGVPSKSKSGCIKLMQPLLLLN
jgi:hypothetical protein